MTTDSADTGNGLKRESKFGIATTLVLTSLATGAIALLSGLDLSSLPGWLVSTATAAVASLIGLLTAYKTKNATK